MLFIQNYLLMKVKSLSIEKMGSLKLLISQ
ncbi:hypothetical protein PA13_1001090 [Pseudomonas aeruginosa HB13]|nr:hypothetical protein PA13_1001090 [Pseudomonas aeruginosa HB13]